MVLNKERFKQQLNVMSHLYMRKLPVVQRQELWRLFRNKKQEVWDRTVDHIIRSLKMFPTPAEFSYYYEMNIPPREMEKWPDRKDLAKAAKSEKAKYYLGLINGLLDGEIDIEDPRIQACLKEQGPDPVFSEYDPTRRCFRKIGRPKISDSQLEVLREGLGLPPLEEYMAKRKKGIEDRKKKCDGV